MSGTKAGAKLATERILAKHGKDHYARIGSLGGKASGTGGFYNNSELARRAGKMGGQKRWENVKSA